MRMCMKTMILISSVKCPTMFAFQVTGVVKNLPANAVNIRDSGLIPGSGSSPRGGPGNPLQYSCLENPMDRGAWWATVHGVTHSQIRLRLLSMHNHIPRLTVLLSWIKKALASVSLLLIGVCDLQKAR